MMDVFQRSANTLSQVINLGRLARERRTVSLKTPLKSLVVLHADQQYLDDVKSLEGYVLDELNIRDLVLSSDEEKYGVQYSVNPDVKSLGQKFKKDAAKIKKAIPGLSPSDIKTFLETGTITVDDKQLTTEDLRVSRGIPQKPETKNLEVAVEGQCLIILDSFAYPELAEEGLARLFLNRVQKLRKTAGLKPTDDVKLSYKIVKDEGNEVDIMFRNQKAMFDKAVQGDIEKDAETNGVDGVSGDYKALAEEEMEVKDVTVLVKLLKI